MSNNPEGDLEQFLATVPACIRKEFESGALSLTQDEVYEWSKVDLAVRLRLLEEYQRLLRCIPAKWREYRARESKANAQLMFPANQSGRPRKDTIAQEAVELQQRGMNSPQIAAELNKRHGKDTTTAAAIPKLIKRFLARTKSSA